MNRGRFAAIASGFAAAGLGLSIGLLGSAEAATATPAATFRHAGSAAAAPRYVVLDCAGKGQVRPGIISLACADNGVGLTNLRWTSWTPQLASAYGTEWENDCKPNCAAGRIHHYPVVVALWGSASVQGHAAERRYTWATLSYKKGRPALYVKSCNGKVEPTYPISQTLPLGF